MATHFHRPLPFVRHMAIGTADATARVNALAPQFEFGMLGLVYPGASFGVCVIVEIRAIGKRQGVPKRLDLLRPQAVSPRERQRHVAGAVIFDMALRAYQAAHFLPRGIEIGIVRARAVACSPPPEAGQMSDRDFTFRQRP
jgi:hypothetical protein